jgi:DNA-binding CsgD family transcriptional regulator
MTQIIDAAVFSDLIGAIYDCSIDPAGWPETLGQLTTELEFANSTIGMKSLPSGHDLINVTYGIPVEWKERMGSFTQDIVAMWGGPSMMWSYPFDRPTMLSRANPAALQNGNRYIREWGEPQGLIDSIVAILAHDSQGIGHWAMGRHRDQGAIRDVDLERATLFIPHLQRAVKISRLFEAQALTAGCFEQVVQELATPIILVGGDLKILHANRSALDLIEDGGLLANHSGRLSINATGAKKAIHDFVAQAGEDETGLRSGAIGLSAMGKAVGVHSIYVLPLQRGSLRPEVSLGAAAAIFVSSPQVARSRLGEVMRVLFGFTAGETRVFEQLVSGRTSQQAAAALGIAHSTVRTHLLRIFGKTGVHRQSDLVQLAADLAPPIRKEATPG